MVSFVFCFPYDMQHIYCLFISKCLEELLSISLHILFISDYIFNETYMQQKAVLLKLIKWNGPKQQEGFVCSESNPRISERCYYIMHKPCIQLKYVDILSLYYIVIDWAYQYRSYIVLSLFLSNSCNNLFHGLVNECANRRVFIIIWVWTKIDI